MCEHKGRILRLVVPRPSNNPRHKIRRLLEEKFAQRCQVGSREEQCHQVVGTELSERKTGLQGFNGLRAVGRDGEAIPANFTPSVTYRSFLSPSAVIAPALCR